MSVRDDIMAMTCNPMKSYDDSEFARYRIGFHHAKNKAVEIAEASEKAQQAKLNALIAELRGLDWCNLTDAHRIDAILDKYEKYEE